MWSPMPPGEVFMWSMAFLPAKHPCIWDTCGEVTSKKNMAAGPKQDTSVTRLMDTQLAAQP